MVVGPAGGADEISALAHLVDPAHACDLDGFLVADADEDGGALEEEGLGVHLEYLEAEAVVVDDEAVVRHGDRLGGHGVLVDGDAVGLELDVLVPEAGREVEVVLLLLDGLALQVVGLDLVLELLHRLPVVPGLGLHLHLQQLHHLLDRPPQVPQRVPQDLRDVLDLVDLLLLLVVDLLQLLEVIRVYVLLALLLLYPLLVLQLRLPQRLLEDLAHLRQLAVEHRHH